MGRVITRINIIVIAVCMVAASAAASCFAEAQPGQPETAYPGWNETHTEYYDGNGNLVTGLFQADGKTHYASRSGLVNKSAGVINTDEGTAMLAGNDGSIVTTPGPVEINGDVYFVLNEQGAPAAGAQRFGDKIYHLSASDYKAIKGIHTWEKGVYFGQSDGSVKTDPGFVRGSGHIYFVGTKGLITRNTFFKYQGKYYYAGKQGAIRTKKFRHRGVMLHPDKATGKISPKEYKRARKNPYPYTKYVLVDISSQTLRYYNEGKVKVRCRVVTGNVSNGHSTPTGTYRVRRKATNVVLKGRDYASHVTYWMPFIGNAYGLHDATWRGSFGGNIYKTNGSHGCVNMPYGSARKLYHKVKVGTLVIIRK